MGGGKHAEVGLVGERGVEGCVEGGDRGAPKGFAEDGTGVGYHGEGGGLMNEDGSGAVVFGAWMQVLSVVFKLSAVRLHEGLTVELVVGEDRHAPSHPESLSSGSCEHCRGGGKCPECSHCCHCTLVSCWYPQERN